MWKQRLAFILLCFGVATTVEPAEKPELWVEVRSPHFVVYSNGGEKQAQRVAEQFEQIRAMFAKAFPNVRVDPGEPLLIFAAKNEQTLKALLPEFWEKKGRMRPAGLFQPGQEKNFVALRTDTVGDNPYHTIYHEYVHLLVRLNYQDLPAWLNEGLAEFWGNTVIGDKLIRTGQPDESHIYLLRDSRLLPIDVLLKVDHGSPYYNESNQASIFYAQSWALVSYLLLDEKVRPTTPISRFIRELSTGKDDTEAAKEVFGDLKKLEKTLEGYIRRSTFSVLEMKKPAEIADSAYRARAVPEAEMAALQGDLYVHTNRPAEAKAVLERALKLDPQSPLAHESMGFMFYRENEREEAAKWFAKAAELDSKNAMAHYFHAMLQLQEALDSEKLPHVEASLRKAIELNSSFAPAYVTISSLYVMQDEDEKAVEAAKKAFQLRPGEMMYAFNLAQILMRTERFEEAEKVARQMLVRPQSEQQKTMATQLLQQMQRFREQVAERKRYEEERRQFEEAERARRAEAVKRYEETQRTLREPTTEPPPGEQPKRELPRRGTARSKEAGKQNEAAQRTEKDAPSQEPSQSELARRGTTRPTEDGPKLPSASGSSVSYGMFGKITDVTCEQPAEMYLTLTMHGITMKLHATNYFKLEYLTTRWQPPPKFNPCVHLKGLTAQVSYKLAQGQAYDGEITSIEVQK